MGGYLYRKYNKNGITDVILKWSELCYGEVFNNGKYPVL